MDNMWAGVDEQKWQNLFLDLDTIRSQLFGNEGHW